MIQSYFKIQSPHTVSLCKSDTIAFNDSLKHCVTIDTSWVLPEIVTIQCTDSL